MTEKTAPYVDLSWNPSSEGAGFAGYTLLGRPAVTPAPPWRVLAWIAPDAGDNPATFETNHAAFRDYGAGVAGPGSAFVDGTDYRVYSTNSTTGYHSRPVVDSRNILPRPIEHWFVSPAKPYLNFPAHVQTLGDEFVADPTTVHDGFVGRARAWTRTELDLPGHKHALHWEYPGGDDLELSEERARAALTVAERGMTVMLHVPRGERKIGTLSALTLKRGNDRLTIVADAELATTDDTPAVAGYNLPAGLVFNGTSQSARVPDDISVRIGSGPFTIIMAARFPATVGATHLSKDNGTGYEFRNSGANTLTVRLRSATGTVTLTDPDATIPFADVHVMAATSPGAGTGAKWLYRDGERVALSTTDHGDLTNTDPLDAGTDGGASFSALAPLRAWGLYRRELTRDEIRAASGYLLGWSGYRMPGGAARLYDARDDRSLTARSATVMNDLAGSGWQATLNGTPAVSGTPWPLSELAPFPMT